jgi:hypothetical protein
MTNQIPENFLSELEKIPDGCYNMGINRPWYLKLFPSKEREGWLTVSRPKPNTVSIMWTTDKDTHYPFTKFGKARDILITNGQIYLYFESALSMWIKYGCGRGGEKELNTAIKYAEWIYKRYYGDKNVRKS